MSAQIYREAGTRTCQFEEYDKDRGNMSVCGEVAYGVVNGHDLCRRHFEYARAIKNIPDEDVRRA